jgi:hypothetical protein
MEKTNPHENYSYSQDYILMTAFIQEVGSLKLKKDRNNEIAIVQEYLEQRVKEIKTRWK